MIEIANDCLQNAKGMLLGKFSKPLGKMVKRVTYVRYFMVDGSVWSWDDDGTVKRCDDPDEKSDLLLMLGSEGIHE